MTLKKLWQRAVDNAYVETFVYGRVGKHNTDTSVDYAVPGRTDYLWVTLSDRTVKAARNEAGVPQTEDLQVKLRVEHGEHVIVGRSTNSSLSVPSETPPSGVLAHATTHQHGGADEVATATPAANAIPKADGSGKLDGWVTHTNVGTSINAATEKVTLADDDRVAGIDTEAANVLTWWKWSTIKAALTTLFNGLYVALTGNQTVAGVKTFSSNILASILRASSAAGLRLEDDAGNLGVFIEDGGFVGINNTNPADALNIGDGTGQTRMRIESTQVDNLHLGLRNTAAGLVGWLGVTTAGHFIFGASNGAELVRIEQGGNVGINTNDPDEKLSIAGGNILLDAYTHGAGSGIFFRGEFSPGGTNNTEANQRNVSIRVRGLGTPATPDGLEINGSDGIVFGTAAADRMVIDANGNVGIGTTAPQGPLHIHDGVGGHLVVTKTGVNGTPQVIIDGTLAGDVTQACMIDYLVYSSAGVSSGRITLVQGGTMSANISIGGGTLVLTLTLTAGGQLSVARTTGSVTSTIKFVVGWL